MEPLKKMEIRTATANDFGGICNLIKSKEDMFLAYPKGKFPFTIKQVAKLSQTREELTVSVDKNIIIGFANLFNFENQQSAFIGNVIIDKQYRGQGFGKELVLYMLDKARSKYRLAEVKISVFNSNTPALLLYSRFGFKPYEIEERVAPNGNKIALIHLSLKLS